MDENSVSELAQKTIEEIEKENQLAYQYTWPDQDVNLALGRMNGVFELLSFSEAR